MFSTSCLASRTVLPLVTASASRRGVVNTAYLFPHEANSPDRSCQSTTAMTARSNTRAKNALPTTRLPHHSTIIAREIAAEACASCGHHPPWVRYPQETATKPTSGMIQSSPRIPSTVCPAPSIPENSHERPSSAPFHNPQELEIGRAHV